MNYWINRMIEHMEPALADKNLAVDLLKEFWNGKKIDVWSIEEVMSVANDNELFISDEDAARILNEAVNRDYNASLGISYGTLEEHIYNFCQERDYDVPDGNLLIGDITSKGDNHVSMR